MTTEEAITYLKREIYDYKSMWHIDEEKRWSEPYVAALEMAIKAMEEAEDLERYLYL